MIPEDAEDDVKNDEAVTKDEAKPDSIPLVAAKALGASLAVPEGPSSASPKPVNPLVEAMRKFESPRRRSIREAVAKTVGMKTERCSVSYVIPSDSDRKRVFFRLSSNFKRNIFPVFQRLSFPFFRRGRELSQNDRAPSASIHFDRNAVSV